MANTYTAIVKKNDHWWIGWIAEVPGVNCQERTRERLLKTLKIALREALAEDADDLAAFEQRKDEPVISFKALLKELKRHGKI